MNARERFSGGTAVVTGGAAGIGEGFVRHLAAIGMRVVIADIDGGRAELLASELTAGGAEAYGRQLDVTDPQAVEDLAAATYSQFGSVELLINNAGLETGGLLWEVTVERWKRLMSVNVDGVYFGIRAFVPRMIAAGTPATIANLSSVGGVATAPLQAPYIVSKHAVLALTECLHQEIAFVGAPIQVSAVLPYTVRSRIFTDAQASAPSGNDAADRVFETMQNTNVTTAMDPLAAAEHMMAGIAAGDFWIFSDDAAGRGSLARRAERLSTVSAPPDPWPTLGALGVNRVGIPGKEGHAKSRQ
jgi:NAD(P)-dependent dehydrogenase (short-subunit alcohol dehydrogenase family)